MKTPKIKVDSRLLVWARETCQQEIKDVANRFNIASKTIKSWENGEKPITFRRLEQLADFYGRPVSTFFLPFVPQEAEALPDLRTARDKKIKFSKDTALAIRKGRYLRNIYPEISPSFKTFSRQGINLSSDIQDIATKERSYLGISIETQKSWKNISEAFDNWRSTLEQKGILVFQNNFGKQLSGLSIFERGKPPVIFLNSDDVPARKIFTLFHEYCHLLLNSGGICRPRSTSSMLERDNSIEAFCDRFASAFLVPKDNFLAHGEVLLVEKRVRTEKAIELLAKNFKVSRQVILLRLFLENKITRSFYDLAKKRYDAEFEKIQKIKKEKQRKTEGGPPPYFVALSERGKPFTKATFQALKNGRISKKDAATYLGVKLGHLSILESFI